MRLTARFFQVLACCLPLLACHQGGSQRGRPAPPPSSSYRAESLLLTTEGASHSIRGAYVTPEFVEAARERPLLGRAFITEEHQPKSRPVVVLSHGLWRQRFGSDPSVIGSSVALNGRAHTIVGVMPKGFDIPAGADVWLPAAGPDK